MSNEVEEGAKRGKGDRDLTQKDRDHAAKRKAEEHAHDAQHKEKEK